LLRWPAQVCCLGNQGVLSLSGFAIVFNLVRCGLPEINIGGTLQVSGLDLGCISRRSSPLVWLSRRIAR
jgi:hypothetical protein